MSVTWIMQQNLVSEPLKWTDALNALGSKWKPIEIVPFSGEVPDVEVDGPALVYGSTTLIKNAHKKKNWNPGTFFDPVNFKSTVWLKKYAGFMLNSDGYATTIKELQANCPDDLFIRPNDDMKDFSGSRIDKAELNRFYESVSAGGFLFDTSLEVFVAPIKDIHKEWRCFIVDGKCVASSQYRLRSMLMKKPGAPQNVIDFANDMAWLWNPEKAFVMDICEDMEGQMRILELNCFNASGVYECDVIEIIKAVEKLF